MKTLFGVIVLAVAYSALACGVEPQGNKTATPAADTTSLAAAATGTPAAGTATSTQVRDTHGPANTDDPKLTPRPDITALGMRWWDVTYSGVTLTVPDDLAWIIGFGTHICSADYEKYVLISNPQLGAQVRVELRPQVVVVAAAGSGTAASEVAQQARASLRGAWRRNPALAPAAEIRIPPGCLELPDVIPTRTVPGAPGAPGDPVSPPPAP